MNRRDFGKGVGIGLASLALGASGVAASSLKSARGDQDAFECAILSMLPMVTKERKLVYGNRTRCYKKKSDVEIKQFLEVNGMGSLVIQLSRGYYDFETIVKIVADIYGIAVTNAEMSVKSFLLFLYNEGFLSFVSETFLIESEQMKGRGVNIPDQFDTNIKVFSFNNKKMEITF